MYFVAMILENKLWLE